ncbi:MAG TPA: tripartite tricarboxylate transporter substrate binding protein [Acetobacteraceae bacterium]|nr:tripartite tricarboxylate transporter substrate binding protein [Acetobacteraceae bacterium]
MATTITRRALLAASLPLLTAPALAQPGFPNRPIRLIVPWPPGGSADTQFRMLGDIAARLLGQPILIENRSGASGTLGATMMASEHRGDGHLVGQMPVTVFRIPAMTRRPPFDPLRDFTYIIHLTGYLFGVVVRGDSPWQTWQDFLDYAKANPGRVTYGTPGVGSTLHITMERIAEMKGIQWVHVPFRGGADTSQALLANQITANADSTGWAPLVDEGRFRLLVTWGEQRARRFPNVPTLRETGVDLVATSPYGVAGPRGMDPGVVRALHDAFKTALHDPAHVAVLDRYDMPVIYKDTEGYNAFVRQLVEEEGAVIRRLGLRTD